MSATTDGLDANVQRWWYLFAVALFLLVPLDLFTTLLAVTKYGTVVEANPLMRWLLQQGMFAVIVVHLAVVGIVVWLFHAAVHRLRQAPPGQHRTVSLAVNVWVGLLLISGILLVANNLAVVL